MKTPKACFTFILVLVLGGFASSTSNSRTETGNRTYEKTPARTNNTQSEIALQHAWALGCAAVLTERNCDPHNMLGTSYKSPKSIEDHRSFLVDTWDIKNRDNLLESLLWIDNGGNRKEFKRWGEKVQSLRNEEYDKLLTEHQGDDKTLNRIKVAAAYYTALGDKSLLGWDYSRYICLCRWGYMAEYLSEEEAWQKIMPVAKLLQNTFDSWQDLGQNYLIGRLFWSYEETKQGGYNYEDAYMRLLDMPSSPWNRLPWDMDLKEEAAPEPNEMRTVDETTLALEGKTEK
jgi:hypothetical protein